VWAISGPETQCFQQSGLTRIILPGDDVYAFRKVDVSRLIKTLVVAHAKIINKHTFVDFIIGLPVLSAPRAVIQLSATTSARQSEKRGRSLAHLVRPLALAFSLPP